jgi:hypothetical protein
MENTTPKTATRIILMARSEMKGGMAPTAHGPFSSVREAEQTGFEKIRSLPWHVATETQKLKDGQPVGEPKYTQVSATFNARFHSNEE